MIKVIGTGSFLPQKRLTNQDLEKMVKTSDEWITQRTGIKERRIVEDGVVTSDLAYEASKKALESAGLLPKDIDMIIVGTSTPDYTLSATAPIVQQKLGCVDIPAFDINSVCTSFTYSFLTAYSMINSGFYKNCLVIGSDVYSKIMNWEDRTTCVIFGDGAGAMILQKNPSKKGIFSHVYGADGSGSELIRVPAGGIVHPAHKVHEMKKEDLFFKMDGTRVYEFSISVVPDTVETLIENSGLSKEDIDWIVLHQANRRIIESVSKRTKIPIDKFIINIEKYGNTSSATIPIAVDEAVKDGRIKEGDKVMMLGFGGGLSWGGFIIEW